MCVCGGAVKKLSVGHRQMDNMLCRLLCVPSDISFEIQYFLTVAAILL